MTKLFFGALLAAAVTASGSVVKVIGFDDLATPVDAYNLVNVWGLVPTYYGGLDWTGWEIMDNDAYAVLYADTPAIPSSPNFAYPGLESELLSIGSGEPFQFLGAELSGWPFTYSPVAQSVTISAYLDGKPVGSTTTYVSPSEWLSSGGIAGLVNELVFAPNDEYFRLDDLTVIETPEPATMALFGVALAGLGVAGIAMRSERRTSRSMIGVEEES